MEIKIIQPLLENKILMGPTGEVPAGASPTDPTGNGGGNIGTGNIPMPGEAGFSSPNIKPPRGEQTQTNMATKTFDPNRIGGGTFLLVNAILDNTV